MKIKEVCQKTDLTERTVRFYIEKGLLQPVSSEINQRIYYDFYEQDIAKLKKIATLRKVGFPIDVIVDMETYPEHIDLLLTSHFYAIKEKQEMYSDIVKVLKNIEGKHFTNTDDLAERLNTDVAGMPLPLRDIKPNFGRFDTESKEEKEEAYLDFLINQRIRDKFSINLEWFSRILRPFRWFSRILRPFRWCILLLLVIILFYLFIPLPMSIRHRISEKNITEIQITRTYYSSNSNGFERDNKKITDKKQISSIIEYFNTTWGIFSFKTITDPDGFSTIGLNDVFAIYCYDKDYNLMIFLNGNHIGYSATNKRGFPKYRIFGDIDTFKKMLQGM